MGRHWLEGEAQGVPLGVKGNGLAEGSPAAEREVLSGVKVQGWKKDGRQGAAPAQVGGRVHEGGRQGRVRLPHRLRQSGPGDDRTTPLEWTIRTLTSKLVI